MLKLSKDLELPITAVTQTFAFLGKRGGGKTYAASLLAEQMLSINAQIIVLDVVGTWYGLRVPKSPKAKAFDILVFGGLNGDIEINPKAGKIVAGIILEKNLSAVVDISQFIHSEQTRFAYDFLITLFEGRKASPGACHIFLEESQELVPQNVPPGAKGQENFAARMLHAGERLVKLGRNFGIGCSLISQRPQEVNKKVLNQTEVLLAFQMTGIQEKKTIRDWVRDKGDETDVEQQLPRLEIGQALVWSPTWLKISGTYKISEKITADVSATPEVGAPASRANTLAKVDVEELKGSIEALTAELEANTPAALKKRIAELEALVFSKNNELANKGKPIIEHRTVEVEVPVPVLDEEKLADLQTAVDSVTKASREIIAKITAALDLFQMMELGQLTKKLADLRNAKPRLLPAAGIGTLNDGPKPPPVARFSPSVERPKQAMPQKSGENITNSITNGDLRLNKTQQRILDALAWYESIGNRSPSLTQIGAVALIDPTGGHFSNTVGPLSSNGLVTREHGAMRLTDAGRALADTIDAPASLDAYYNVLRQRVMKMKSGSRRSVDMMDAIIAAGGQALTTEQIGSAIGIDHTGGHFSNTIGPLSTAGLITRSGGVVQPTDVLFPEGLA